MWRCISSRRVQERGARHNDSAALGSQVCRAHHGCGSPASPRIRQWTARRVPGAKRVQACAVPATTAGLLNTRQMFSRSVESWKEQGDHFISETSVFNTGQPCRACFFLMSKLRLLPVPASRAPPQERPLPQHRQKTEGATSSNLFYKEVGP